MARITQKSHTNIPNILVVPYIQHVCVFVCSTAGFATVVAETIVKVFYI